MQDESVVTNYHLDDDQLMDNTIRPESILVKRMLKRIFEFL